MRKKPLTQRQREILKYIHEYIEREGYAPSIRDICSAFDISSSRGAHRHLEALELKGYIERKSTPRSIKIIQDPYSTISTKVVNLPLLGEITAGRPIFASENIEDIIPIASDVAKNIQDGFLLRVEGDSMIGDGIHDGDVVIVKPQPHAESGEIVVAIIEDGATVKRFYKEENHVKLQPSNVQHEPIIMHKDFKVIGKVMGLLRKY